MKMLYLDCETTGLRQLDRLCQLAYIYESPEARFEVNELFDPGVEMQPMAEATHHITTEILHDKPRFAGSSTYSQLVALLNDGAILIAHNAKFDIGMLQREGIQVPKHICTVKLARYLLKDDKSVTRYTLQLLREYFNIEIDATAHDAYGDVLVLEKVFNALLSRAMTVATTRKSQNGKLPEVTLESIINRMIDISMTPASATTAMPFGKYAGQPLRIAVANDKRYFEWLVSTSDDKTDDLIVAINRLLV